MISFDIIIANSVHKSFVEFMVHLGVKCGEEIINNCASDILRVANCMH